MAFDANREAPLEHKKKGLLRTFGKAGFGEHSLTAHTAQAGSDSTAARDRF